MKWLKIPGRTESWQLPEKSIKHHSPSDQLFLLSGSAHTAISLIVFKKVPTICWTDAFSFFDFLNS